MKLADDPEDIVFLAIGNRHARIAGGTILALTALVCLFTAYFGWVAWTRIEDRWIRYQCAAAALSPLMLILIANRSLRPRAIRYLITQEELVLFHGNLSFSMPLEGIADAKRITHAEFFNKNVRLGGKSALFRPYFFYNPSIVDMFVHIDFGNTLVCANRAPHYCLLSPIDNDDPQLLISPENFEEFLQLIHQRLSIQDVRLK